ncbi:hypothetical protein [Psychrobacter sp. MES7-P7E]|uniref:hypothetical protein n=1 Tax=Psychrobacter sp. MES7-P7E TaxID=2058322 RepID=UPI000C7E9463|nr:hypothetical protein [Psychrobacter sp. MES7-P7E]PLT21111.1 hypothetical protein CXF62_11450 [Psychrobacter sp. MES7-P7E]
MNKPKERPVIFSTQEVNAVLAGDKTQHRVIIENTKDTQCLFSGDWRYDGRDFLDDDGCTPDPKGAHYVERLEPSEGEERQYTEDYRCIGHCPLGNIGDRLWVQEPTLAIEDVGWLGPVYVASTEGQHAIDWGYGPYDDPAHIPACDLTYNKSCDLSYEESRMLLEITDIRIERIKDISEADAKAMGLKPDYCDHKHQTCEDIGCIGKWASALFLHLRHEKKLAVHYTDWFWVIDFKVIEGVHTNG